MPHPFDCKGCGPYNPHSVDHVVQAAYAALSMLEQLNSFCGKDVLLAQAVLLVWNLERGGLEAAPGANPIPTLEQALQAARDHLDIMAKNTGLDAPNVLKFPG